MSLFPQAKFIMSANAPGQFVHDRGREVAFAGRSNSGKSTAINTILNRRGLARTSKRPGRTQLVNFFDLGDNRRVVDLPGYGYARVPPKMQEHWGNLMETYFTGRRSLCGLILIMDVRFPMTAYDRQMLAWAEGTRCTTHILLTKADKLSRSAAGQVLRKVDHRLGPRHSVQLFSATKKTGVEQARDVLQRMLFKCGKREAGRKQVRSEE